MELIRGEHNLRPRHHGCVATIGNFDGVHRGHQAVVGQLREEAARRGLPSTLITFEPLPHEYFMGPQAPARLTPLRERLCQFAALGVDRVLILRFDLRLSGQTADDFVQRLLVDRLGVKSVIVGDDFRYGQDRAGDFDTLVHAGQRLGFDVLRQDTYTLGDARVSSTRIRQALATGDLAGAEHLLGRPFTISGRVRHGDQRGRTIGFPTANLALHRGAPAISGVFAVEVRAVDVRSADGLLARGVANVGKRPTVGGVTPLLEVHLFDFTGDLYGRHLRVALRRKIRDERRFESFAALQQQIREDADLAEAILSGQA
ncbi:bifunctional riboflavin kinase/FAD synthetase [Acidihalobacter ferrooxydans]|uniref:Riboflavin biosynthesis protein n=1 Tax=Acidihalobacter ferrooxydans TaxID=1765967 RepID=A0A1P8UD41_9GAMM|nr:bifunctional riboflavin kinase/FAD synthetase [Acidihalobacter ferrooxydans]APZ41713.1 riboflavin biosynthesis protein RibF [Acidihalobacter ferrooxydans]